MLSERIAKLRDESVHTRPYISSQRAELLTDFYASGEFERHAVPIARAKAFQYIMENKTIYIGDGELIVGERGEAPRSTPTYPELCCHSLDDFDVMHERDRTKFLVSDEVRTVYREKVIPFWQGRTMHEKVFETMTPEWKTAFEAGVFTEFMEQRAPGHSIHDDKIYNLGLAGFQARIDDAIEALDYTEDLRAQDKFEELTAMRICCDAVIRFAERHAEKAELLATTEADPIRKAELLQVAEVCRRVPRHPAQSFHEALQSYWFVHLGVITELNCWDSFNPGRLDQHLNPYYQQEIGEGSLTREQAVELMECFWVKFNNQPAPPKNGVTEEQSGTYQDFALLNCGGITLEGANAVNEVSYLMLDVLEEMEMMMPSCCIQLSKKNPERFLRRACKVVKAGFGQPSIFNTDVIVKEFLHAGKSLADARDGGPSGCVTIASFGKEACSLTGYVNWPKILELALHDGCDPRTGVQVGPKTGTIDAMDSFEAVQAAYLAQMSYFVDLKIAGENRIERLYTTRLPAPFLSTLVDDCIANGMDYHAGGARYNVTYLQGVGIATLTDMLSSIKHNVFEKKAVTLPALVEACGKNFAGDDKLRTALLDAPKYGNDDDRADDLTEWSFNAYYDLVNGRPNTKTGHYRVNLLPTTCHIYFGRVLGATPDGRHATLPVSDGISPSQGADVKGPTAVIKSAARIDHARTGGTLLNVKFSPDIMDEAGLEAMAHLVRSYFRMDGHHVQFNIVTADTLHQAKKEPEKHRDLIVRVAGYSDYFIDLGEGLQDEIIARTEHESMA